jgi:predicted lipid-binding transport protein (Tim44 family)
LQRQYQGLGGDQYTEVVTLKAELLGTRRDADQLVASIHFSGLVREERNAEPGQVSEIWHMIHDWDSPQGDWYVAGIQQAGQ